MNMVNFSNVIFYVKDIQRAIAFYKNAFGFEPKFIHESNQYAEIDTGATVLAFASESLGESNLPQGYIHHDIKQVPFACEIVFTVSNVQEFYEKALKAGGIHVVAPEQKPWGQTVAYVRDPNGVLIDIASHLE